MALTTGETLENGTVGSAVIQTVIEKETLVRSAITVKVRAT